MQSQKADTNPSEAENIKADNGVKHLSETVVPKIF
jgi:hypothetical protein